MDTTNFLNEVEPFYFGTSPQRLYGCHHLPHELGAKPYSVVLCSPVGQEYIQSHRAAYQLAVRLSRCGYHVLRFDYFGCGDSEGNFEQATIIQWIDDIHSAIEEIQNRSGLTNVCLIGLRIGASLVLKVTENNHHIERIALWEPILDGKVYLKELDKRQRKFFLDRFDHGRGWHFAKVLPSREILGFPMTSELRQTMEMIKMENLTVRSDFRVLFVFNDKKSKAIKRLKRLAERQPNLEIRVVADHRGWEQDRFIPYKSLDCLVNWMGTDNL